MTVDAPIPNGTRVSLAPADWLKILGIVIMLAGVGIKMWTGLAVLEAKVDGLAQQVTQLQTKANH